MLATFININLECHFSCVHLTKASELKRSALRDFCFLAMYITHESCPTKYLHLPTKFFHSSCSNSLYQVTYGTRLKGTMKQLRTTPTHHHARQKPNVSSDLSHCTHVLDDRMQYEKLCNSLATIEVSEAFVHSSSTIRNHWWVQHYHTPNDSPTTKHA